MAREVTRFELGSSIGFDKTLDPSILTRKEAELLRQGYDFVKEDHPTFIKLVITGIPSKKSC